MTEREYTVYLLYKSNANYIPTNVYYGSSVSPSSVFVIPQHFDSLSWTSQPLAADCPGFLIKLRLRIALSNMIVSICSLSSALLNAPNAKCSASVAD